MRSTKRNLSRINFQGINEAALPRLKELLCEWLPSGRLEGKEWVALNPNRSDYSAGSFKINLNTGKWADFASGDRGGDPISLYAYLYKLRQAEAACRLADRLGVHHV